MKTKNLVYTALICGIMCVMAPIALPIGPIPITLTTFVIYIIGAVFDIRISVPAIIIYIALGSLGLPIFSGFSGGIGQILGPGGGFILGYLPLTICLSLFRSRKGYLFPSMLLGTFVLYTVGCIWYMIVTEARIYTAITVTILPFIIFDIIKMILAVLFTPKIRLIFNRI